MGFYLQPHVAGSQTPKPLSTERQLSVPGRRFYGPSQGRWLSRDPLGELRFRQLLVRENMDVLPSTQGCGFGVSADGQPVLAKRTVVLGRSNSGVLQRIMLSPAVLDHLVSRYSRFAHSDGLPETDLIRVLIGDSAGPSLYPFGGYSPVTGVDPDGEFWIEAGAILIGMGLAAVFVLEMYSSTHPGEEVPRHDPDDETKSPKTKQDDGKGELCPWRAENQKPPPSPRR